MERRLDSKGGCKPGLRGDGGVGIAAVETYRAMTELPRDPGLKESEVLKCPA